SRQRLTGSGSFGQHPYTNAVCFHRLRDEEDPGKGAVTRKSLSCIASSDLFPPPRFEQNHFDLRALVTLRLPTLSFLFVSESLTSSSRLNVRRRRVPTSRQST